MKFRILSYNIHKGIGGVDRRYCPERIVETIEHYSPDIALLQEVDEGVPRSESHCQVEMMALAMGFRHHAFQRNVRLKIGHYGNAILSRFPLTQVDTVDLTVPLKKRRQALVASVSVHYQGHSRTLTLANVHLGLAGFERKSQLNRLLGHSLMSCHHKNSPILIGGDFNDVWGNLGKHIMFPAGFTSAGEAIHTFPATLPLRPLDRIFIRGAVLVHHAFAGHTRLAKQASDHLPLVVDLELQFQ
jgi:endonuclease/exonuclease/phosphatase family metal-dependent hydrolase